MSKLGKLSEITDLRTIWGHEARDFSAWLAKEQNLEILSDTIGIPIVIEERESRVGSYSVDLFGYEDITNKKIVIENQLETTDHDHLGKIITYAAGKSADIVIWIVKHSREEHQKAIEWLNNHVDDISFFLLEIKLWKIGESLPAAKFEIIEQPNNWAKIMRNDSSELSGTKKIQLEFWQAFTEYAYSNNKHSEFRKLFNRTKEQALHWYTLTVGSSKYHISFTVNTVKKIIGAEIYINDDKEIFFRMQEYKKEIEDLFNEPLEWIEATKACRILAVKPGDIKIDINLWESYFDWFCESAIKLRTIIKKYAVN